MACIALLLFMICGYLLVISPRPYTLFENDIESAHFHNSLIWDDGFVSAGGYHPGLPPRYAYLLAFKIWGRDTGPSLQHALNGMYIFAGFMYVIAAAFSFLVLRRAESTVASAFAVFAAIVSPPSLHFLNHFGTGSFILPFGLPLFALTWVTLRSGRVPTVRVLLGLGLLGGLGLATKLSLIPVIFAVGIGLQAACFSEWAPPASPFRAVARRLLRGGLFWVGLVVGHVLVALPQHVALIPVWKKTLLRPDSKPEWGRVLQEIWTALSVLFRVDPVLALVVVSAALFVALAAVAKCRQVWGPARRGTWLSESIGFPTLTYSVVAVLGLAFTLGVGGRAAENHPFFDAGFPLRNVLPSLLGMAPVYAAFLGFVVLFFGRRSASQGRTAGRVLVAFTIMMVVTAVPIHLVRRGRYLSIHKAQSEAATSRFAELRPAGTRIAFWDGSQGDVFGEAGFRLWGNRYWYRNSAYDRETLRRFPDYTLFNLRHVGHVLREAAHPSEPHVSRASATASAPGWKHVLTGPARKGLEATFLKWFPLYSSAAYGAVVARELFTGQTGPAKVHVGLIVYPKDQEAEELQVPREKLLRLIESQLGPVDSWEEDLAGRRWVVIRRVSSGGGPSGPGARGEAG